MRPILCGLVIVFIAIITLAGVIRALSRDRNVKAKFNKVREGLCTTACGTMTVPAQIPDDHATLLYEGLRAWADFAERHGLEYYAGAGSLVGAVRCRPGGVLPWDDDVDIYMRAPEYDRFVEAAAKDAAFPFVFGPHVEFGKQMKLVRESSCRSSKECYIDVFALDDMGTHWQSRTWEHDEPLIFPRNTFEDCRDAYIWDVKVKACPGLLEEYEDPLATVRMWNHQAHQVATFSAKDVENRSLLSPLMNEHIASRMTGERIPAPNSCYV